MAHISLHAPRAIRFDAAAVLAHAVDGIKEFAARRAAFRVAYNELNALTDRELSDIGITRFMIRDVARQAAARV